MINAFLHGLTNRSILSATPNTVFVSDPSFQPAPLADGDLALRQALCLDVPHDYYLQVYAALMEAYPDIKALLQDPATSYKPSDFLPRGVITDGATLASNGLTSGFFTDPPVTSMPIPLTYILTYVGVGSINIQQVETGQSDLADCYAAIDPHDIWLRVQWPARVPFQGVLRLNQPWQSGATVSIMVTPSQFPYAVAVQRLLNIPYFSQLLQLVGMQASFDNAIPQDQLVMALAAIAISNPAAYTLA